MGKVKGCWFSEPDCVPGRSRKRSLEARPIGGAIGCRGCLIGVAALLFVSTMTACQARAQDEPPKAAPVAPSDPPEIQIPPPPDVEKKDSTSPEPQKKAPSEERKDAPTAPAEKQQAMPPAIEDVQKKAAFVSPETLDEAMALSSRYRFVERYSLEDHPERPDLISQYRVGSKVTTKIVREKAQAAPERSETSHTEGYVERAARVTRTGEAIDLIRRYDRVIIKELAPSRSLNPPFLEGLLVWYHRRPPIKPQIISLTDRGLREDEYNKITEGMSLPQLMSFFPIVPTRVNESWSISAKAVQDVSGELPSSDEFDMNGKIVNVSKTKDNDGLVAVISITGQFNLDIRPCAFSGTIEFTFIPRMVPRPRTGAEDAPRIVEAAGQITDARLAQTMAASLHAGEGRAKILATREVWLQRRPLAQKGERGGPTVPIDLPAAVPVATVANSWLTYDDPDGRFQLRHPQDLQPPSLPDRTPAAVDLENPGRDSRFGLKLPPTGGETQDPSFRDAAHFQKAHEDQFAGADISWGKPGWLDDPVWQDLSGKVYRMEGAWKRDNAETPVYIDLYYVELDRNRATQRFVVESWTVRPDHLAFRNQTEEMIRLFKLGRAEKRVLASPGAGSAPRTTPSAGSAPAPTESAPAAAETAEPAAAKTAKPATAPVAPPQ